VKRASKIEYEEVAIDNEIKRGWSIRAEHDPELALRMKYEANRFVDFVVSKDPSLPIIVFHKREEALRFEVEKFWELLPPKERT
jgi:hypothetical protein